MFKRKIDKALSGGLGSQLLWLLLAVMLVLLVFRAILSLCFPDWDFYWQDMLAIFLDPGCFEGKGEHDIFRLIVALTGVLLFSTLLISVFNNIFDNIVDLVKTGRRRYSLSGHILILGAGNELLPVLRKLHRNGEKRDIVIMTGDDIEELQSKLELQIGDRRFVRRLYLYHGRRDEPADLQGACARNASLIYIFGDSGEDAHDSCNMAAYKLLYDMCENGPSGRKSSDDIQCYVSLESDVAMDVLARMDKSMSGKVLKVDFVCSEDNTAEQLLLRSDFLPVITKESKAVAHIVILGTGAVADRLAVVAANICHYPNFADGSCRRTLVSVVGPDIQAWSESFIASKRGFFDLCRYSYMASDGSVVHHEPSPEYGDFLDVELEFIEGESLSPFIDGKMAEWIDAADKGKEELRLIICEDRQQDAEKVLSGLPSGVLKYPKAVYVEHDPVLLELAAESGKFGDLQFFGPGSENYDPMFELRTQAGREVNDIYVAEYGDGQIGRDAWYSLHEWHKISSIYCNYAMPLRRKCFALDCEARELYECEHRRWMCTTLLNGCLRALPKAEIVEARRQHKEKEMKTLFFHVDIEPYDNLPEEEKDKDKILIDKLFCKQ